MEDKGSFSHLDIYKFFVYAGENRLNTILYFSEGFREYRVFFKNGKISFILSGDKDERFGEFLVVTNKITIEQYRITSEKILQEGKKFGYALIEEGFMTVEELYNSLNEYMLFLISQVFSLKEGVFAKLEFETHTELPMNLTIDFRKAIYHGIKKNSYFSLIDNYLPDLKVIPKFIVSVEDVFKVLPLSVEEQEVLEWIDGQNSISSICNYSNLSQFETLKLLLILKFSNFIKFERLKDEESFSINFEEELEKLLNNYNSKFEKIYTILNSLNPELFERLNTEVFEMLEDRYGELVRDIDFSSYGYIDFDAFYRNLYNLNESERLEIAEKFLEDVLKETMFFIEENGEKDFYQSLKKVIYERKA
ncbi:conserved hypothetical protein [Thermotomaculum hydrothermale]|uniref:PatA-like N-terminal domain-containing protein n=1 Tax=Thermotomaculum hydrothermale TaxID=981385 RepID=A0A7R6PGC0_9BACT|nr:DUF4388 domain-containing protein [Thermotomaculum hydrothermale]BBB32079.1 conserved hypothetical protein [Thermotomaculum hydrothermale]